MRIVLRYFAGCPSWRLAEERLRAALTSLGASGIVIALEPVETHQEAERLGFVGSPTILVDGRDPFVGRDAPMGLACRVYVTDEGLQGAPTVTQLRAALAG
jgi:hypothetical protein